MQRLVDADVGGVARAEVVTRQDDEPVVGSVPEPFGEGELRRHARDAIGQVRCRQPTCRRSLRSASRLRRGERRRERRVRLDRERLCVPLLDDLEVDEQAVVDAMDVAEQPAVVVAPDDVAFDAHLACRSGAVSAVNADASGPKHSIGVFGFLVSGVSIPISRTRSSRPPIATSIVSPSTTWVTVASPSPGVPGRCSQR